MKHPLLRLGLRGAVVGSALVFGCSQGRCPCTSGPISVDLRPCESSPAPAQVARAEQARPTRRPEVKVLQVLPAGGASEEQELATADAVSPPAPPVVVPAARQEAASETMPYGHAPDYRWLTGELRYSPARGVWCIRYAAEDEEDRHGGSVTLVGVGALTGLHPGQAVRVEGEMIDPETREPSTSYRVHSLRPLPHG